MKQDNSEEMGFMRLPEILNYIPIGKSTWWKGVKSGRFPKGIKLGTRTTAWKKADIKRLLKDFEGSSSLK